MKHTLTLLTLLALTFTPPLSADENDNLAEEQQAYDESAYKSSNPKMIDRISQDFEVMLESQEEPAAVVQGLRTGEAFTYNQQEVAARGGMGYGNIYTALALAEHNGGDLQQVLAMRESGIGWGDIAHSMDTKVGHLISRIKSGRALLTPTVEPPPPPTDTGAVQVGTTQQTRSGYRPSGVGVVDAMGNSITNPGAQRGNRYGQSDNKANRTHPATGNSAAARINPSMGSRALPQSGIHGNGNSNGNAYGHGKRSQ